MLVKALYSLLVWIAVSVVCILLGKLFVFVDTGTIQSIGKFLQDNAGLIGFLAALVYFISRTALPRP